MLKTLQKAVLPRQRLSDQIRDELKRMILRGDLKRGIKLPTEEQLAVQLKVSKVSVRADKSREKKGDRHEYPPERCNPN
jgi:DNA-binding GntR family transcriptional regulator